MADNISREQLPWNKMGNVIKQEDEGYHTVYQMRCPDGYGIRSVYRVFTGLDLVYDEFNTTDFSGIIEAHSRGKTFGKMMEISYCREGRLECAFQNGLYVYMGQGDFFAGLLNAYPGVRAFPMENYQGISLYVDPDLFTQKMPPLLQETSINIYQIQNRLLPDPICIRRAEERVARVFLDLYQAPEPVRKAYLELKVMELLLLFGARDNVQENEAQKYYPRRQVELIKRIQKQITGDLRQRHTIEELSQEHGISRTALKVCFKGVYGTSVAAYMKNYRIKCAAVMLRRTNGSVSEIAFRVGYENQSKFAAAFKEITGRSPLEYRKMI
ncbi:transcriptional regulator, AraC family [Syntrophobotulus glycolicus DSM 8271]|uniref:Transcriptional regulator, AraC family n=1 Tax=Syntrophobotulus glycolicus (strain DSM 8271 / FlGlyR) TaxID=645991 RepID=F0SX11_SYNGF|nr:AraC family transcriptional regulator [Syntrophobotulus glycolicus]ADY55794.1 transcriptional regulator, AraC family [Syntrophobotulus glycolicus DSM 8271]